MVVIAADNDGRDSSATEFRQQVVDQALGVGWRGRRIEKITGHEQGIDVFAASNLENLVQYGGVLVVARASLERLANMPIGCV